MCLYNNNFVIFQVYFYGDKLPTDVKENVLYLSNHQSTGIFLYFHISDYREKRLDVCIYIYIYIYIYKLCCNVQLRVHWITIYILCSLVCNTKRSFTASELGCHISSPVSSTSFPLPDDLAISYALLVFSSLGLFRIYKAHVAAFRPLWIRLATHILHPPSRPEGTCLPGAWLGKIRFPVSVLHFFYFAHVFISYFGDQFTCIYM